jgi:hypothetical protein
MKDDFREYLPDPSSRNSVTDWLMKVISAKKSDLGAEESDKGANTETKNSRAEATSRAREAAKSAVAVAEMPREEEIARPVSEFASFSADDLCGPPLIKPVVVRPKDEITADDVCFVPPEHRITPDILRETAREPEPIAVASEPQEHVVTAADIMRDSAVYQAEHQNGFENFSATAVQEPEHEVTIADLTRAQALSEMEVPAVDAQPEVQAEVSPEAEPETAVASAEPVVAPEIETQVVEPEAVQITEPQAAALPAEETSQADRVTTEPQPEVQAGELVERAVPTIDEPEIAIDQREIETTTKPLGIEAIAGIVAAASLAHEAEKSHGETKKGKAEPQAADAKESMFAHEGIWGAAPRTGGAPDELGYPDYRTQEPLSPQEEAAYAEYKRGFLRPEDRREVEDVQPPWKTLLQLGSVLPWLARSMPGHEGAQGSEPGLLSEGRSDISDMRIAQYEIRTTIHDHSLQLKRMEEQLTRIRESVDSKSADSDDLMDSVESTVKMVRMIGIGLGALLIVLIIMVGLSLGHAR